MPVVAGGKTEDKAEIANRVGEAVRKVLGDPSYRDSARRIQAELAAKDAATEAATLLERLADTKAPVLRS